MKVLKASKRVGINTSQDRIATKIGLGSQVGISISARRLKLARNSVQYAIEDDFVHDNNSDFCQ